MTAHLSDAHHVRASLLAWGFPASEISVLPGGELDISVQGFRFFAQELKKRGFLRQAAELSDGADYLEELEHELQEEKEARRRAEDAAKAIEEDRRLSTH
jgi:hypothetical protein